MQAMPNPIFRPSKTLLKTAEYTLVFAIAFSFLFVARKASSVPPSGQGQITIEVQTWDQINNSGNDASDPGGSTTLLKGINAAGSSAAALYQGSGPVAKDGDLIELGFFKLDDGTANTSATDLFAGTWTPITTKTTIGHKFDTTDWTDGSNAGEFFFDVTFSRDSLNAYSANANINVQSDSGHEITNDTPSGLGGTGSGNLYALDNATHGAASGAEARLGIRFYDISQTNNTGWDGSNKANAVTTYNTIMNPNWKWDVIANDTGAEMFGIMNLHATNGSVDSNLKFEFDNTDARTANISKIGTGDNQLLNDDFVATIMYHDGSGNLDVSDAGLGSIIVSGFDGSGEVDGANNANIFTIHAAAGNTGADAFTFSGNIFQDGSTSSDLTIVKEGGGEQILTGNVNVADSTNTNTSGGLNIQEGTLKLAPAASKTHKFEYLHGEAGTTLVLDNSNQETVELGFANTTYASYGNANPTHSGAVTLEGSNGNVTIKVVSDTAKTDANYGKEQVISGVVSGTESLTKSGLGRLMLSGTNTFDGGATDVVISDGTLVAAHADALGGANTKVVINKGKLEIGDGNNGAVTLHTGTTIEGSASGKSMVGGDGTINALTVGSATAEVDVISPGRGISSSLTSNTSRQQVTLGTGDAQKATGDLTVTNLTFNDGGVYDWEISDFSGSGGDGWDVLQFNSLTFDSSGSFTINILSVKDSDGSAGAASNLALHDVTAGSSGGIKFLDGPSHGDITWGAISNPGSSGWNQVDSFFALNEGAFKYHNGNLNGGWSVWYDGGGDFYLRFSAVPEPSTYVMVTGLLLLPGLRLYRRFRKGGKGDGGES